MTETILRLLTRLSEAGDDAILTGAVARPFQGPLFDRLLSRRVFVEDAPLTEWDVCDRCDCGLASRPIRYLGSERFRAECPLDRSQDVDLTENDLQVYRVEAAGLASVIGAAAGFKDAPSQLVKGLWRLGVLASGRIVTLAFEAAALTGETIVATLRQAAQGQDVTILVPAIPPAAAKRLAADDVQLVLGRVFLVVGRHPHIGDGWDIHLWRTVTLAGNGRRPTAHARISSLLLANPSEPPESTAESLKSI